MKVVDHDDRDDSDRHDDEDDRGGAKNKPLARTGSDLAPLVALAAMALVLGTLVAGGARRPALAGMLRRPARSPKAEFRPVTTARGR